MFPTQGPTRPVEPTGSHSGFREMSTTPLIVLAPGSALYQNSAFSLWTLPTEATSFTARHRAQSMPGALSSSECTEYRAALESELAFLRKHIPAGTLPVIPADASLQSAHSVFEQERIGKLGLRHIVVDHGQASATWCVAPYPAYKLFSRHPNQEVTSFAATVGAAALITTSDGKIILQHRSDKNDLYKGTLACSAAGLVNAPRLGSPEPLDVLRHARATILKEQREEIGSSPIVSTQLRLGAIILGHHTTHHEIPFSARTSMHSGEVLERVRANDFKDTPFSFRENALWINASPEAIERLLTKALTPIPDTHAAMLALEGFQLMQRRGPETNAHRWLGRVMDGMEQNITRINSAAGGRYDAGATLISQGLPSVRDELARLFTANEYGYAEHG